MKISLDWLSQYVDIDTEPARLADMLTMSGFEVEAVFDPWAHLAGAVCAKVIEVREHPDADRLKHCTVDTGDAVLSIVCGAPNVVSDMNAACAAPGSVLPSGEEVTVGTIRGQRSEGMLCSASELGIGTDASTILALENAVRPGTPLAEALGLSDTVFEIGLTPNRPDCLSFMGIAREVAALTDRTLRRPDTVLAQNAPDIRDLTSVEIQNPDMCPRYSARLLSGVTVGRSPQWLEKRLLSVGLKPINSIVDITNYVMMETGQPLHAFDFDRLAENRIVVRTRISEAEKTFVTLDGKERAIEDDMLMICDGKAPVAVAGVMGGENSEITQITTNVLIESAHFDPVSIRKTAKRLGLATDASHRFERGVDPEGTVYAMDRAAALIAEIAGGEIHAGVIDEYPRPAAIQPIRLSAEKTNRHLGTSLDPPEIGRLLSAIGFEVSLGESDIPGQSDTMDVLAPSFRMDVTRPEDLMEEVARLSGYDNIAVTYPAIPARTLPPLRSHTLKEQLRDRMAGLGFNEAIHYSFTGKNARILEFPEGDLRHAELPILNPLSETQSVMRTTLIGSLLEACQKNLFRQIKDLKLFELGKAFYSRGTEALPEEQGLLAAVWTGARRPASWHGNRSPCDFYDIKGILESLFSDLRVGPVTWRATPADRCAFTRPGQSATIHAGDIELGVVGEIKESIRKQYDIGQKVFAFEIVTDRLFGLVPESFSFSPVPRFPATSRDMTLIIDETMPAGDIVQKIRKMNVDIIEDILVFDVYSGKPIEAGKKSVSIRITYRSRDKTLEEEPVSSLHQEITEKLITEFGADLPG